MKIFALCCLLGGVSVNASAEGISLLRADGNRGTFGTIQEAVNEAQAGDTIIVPEGTYREVVNFVRSGQEGAPITLKGKEGAHVILDGADPDFVDSPAGRWKPYEHDGVTLYQAQVPFRGSPASLSISTWVSRAGVSGSNGSEQLLAAYASLNALKDGVRGEGTFRRGQTIFVRLADDEDPNNVPLNIGKSISVIDLADKSFIHIKNLEIRNAGWTALRLGSQHGEEAELGGTAELDKAELNDDIDYRDIILSDLIIRNSFRGISAGSLRGQNLLIDRVVIANGTRRDEWPWSGAYSSGVGQASGNNSDALAPWRGFGIRLTNTKDSVIRNSVISGQWDGIGIKQSHNLDIHNNTIRTLMDDGIELESPNQSEIYFFNNHLYNVFAGVSVTANAPGPMYVFRNVVEVTHPGARAFVPSYGVKSGHDNYGMAEQIKFYHNTFYSGSFSVWEKYGDPAPNRWTGYDFVNNVFHTFRRDQNYNFRGKAQEDDGGDNLWEGNLYNKSEPENERLAHTVPDLENYFLNLDVESVEDYRDLRLRADTPERDTGSDYVLRAGWRDTVDVNPARITRGAWTDDMAPEEIGAPAEIIKRVEGSFRQK